VNGEREEQGGERGRDQLGAAKGAGTCHGDPLGLVDDARRAKRRAEADADRGELVDLTRVRFGDYARDWIAHYPGRTSRGFRDSTRAAYRLLSHQSVKPGARSARADSGGATPGA
jgi:hypothetical protein